MTMNLIRAALFAICALAQPALAQVPPPVPTLPDTERRVQYSPSVSPGPFQIPFALYGTGTDYGNWIEVWVNGVRLTPVTDFTVTLTSGTLATAARPLTNAQVTLNVASSGTVQIVGAERPRRLAQFAENVGVSARNLNLAITDLVAQNRETWDKINDVTGRGLFSQPGVTLGPLPTPTACANAFLGFDGTGLNPTCLGSASGLGDVIGPSSAVNNNIVTFNGITGKLIKDSGIPISQVAAAITGLTGDCTATGPGTVPCTLATVNANTGAFGSSTAIPNFTTNAKGQILAAGTNVVIAPAGTLSGAALNTTILTSSLTTFLSPITTGVWNGTTIAVARGGTGIATGTSGGVLAFTAAGTLASSGALTANLPVIGGGAGVAPGVGTRSGNTTAFATVTGAMTSGDCVSIDGSGNLVAAGGACTTGGGGGTVTSSTAGQIAYYATTSTTVVGNPNATMIAGTMTLGQTGSVIGSLKLSGNTSGLVSINPQAAAGTYNFNLPITAGTAGQPLLSGGGGAAAQTYGTLGVPGGGTGLAVGVSGGIPYFSGTTTIASSALLVANLPIIGGGAGGAPISAPKSGPSNNFVTYTGATTSGRCAVWSATGDLVESAGAGCIYSVIAGTGLTGGTITTTGTIALDLTRANTWTGALTTAAAAYFKSGRPWADVVAWGAACDNTTNDKTAFQDAIDALQAAGAGGILFVPSMGGNCRVASTLAVTGPVCFVGTGPGNTGILATTDIQVLDFATTVDQGCVENLSIYGFPNNTGTQPVVIVRQNAKVHFRHCRIWGGYAALYTLGVDGRMYDCFVAANSTNAGSASVLSQGANFYTVCKFDQAGATAPVNGFYQLAPAVPGTVLENHLTDCDFSGAFTNSIKIDDGANVSAVTWIHGGVTSSPILINNAKWTVVTTLEMGSTSFTHDATGTLTIGESFSASAMNVTGAGADRLCSNNKRITC